MESHLLLFLLLVQHFGNCEGNPRQYRTVPMQFTQVHYNATVYENSAVKTYVGHPVKMGIYIGNSLWDIKYKIISGDSENMFKAEEYILGDFCFLRIRTKGGNTAILNREVKDNYLLTVKAIEKNTNAEARTKVRVQVLDTNDLRPLFSPTSYSVSLPENTAIRTSIARVSATDADIGTNGEFYYSFKERTDMFAIHPTSGVVVLTGRLDYSEIKVYEMEILAVDRGMKLYGSSGISSMARLTVHIEQANEHAPVITALALAPSEEDEDPEYAVVTVEDRDHGANGEVASLSIVAGDPLQQFKAVRTFPGGKEYKIKAVGSIDWESRPSGYNLTVQAKDKGNPPKFSSPKVIHVASPQFRSGPVRFERDIYRVEISEFAPPNTPVVMVKALHPNSHFKYIFKNAPDEIRFNLNPHTGLITTLDPIKAHHASQFEFDIMTSDRKASTKVLVKVLDENTHSPEFTQTSYKASFDENVPVGTSVMSVSAKDLDEGESGYITYSIANINSVPFVINHFTGVISTAENMDYELMPRIYKLRIRASDWGTPYRREVEVPVTIVLNNLNDNTPLFEKINCVGTIPRELSVGEQITTVSAIDADELQLVQYQIVSGNELDLFSLNPNSGVLSLKQSLGDGLGVKASFHSLRITATDGENFAIPLYINITVVASHKPVNLQCEETGVAKMLAEKLLQANKLHGRGEVEDTVFDTHSVNLHAPQFGNSLPSSTEVKEDQLVGASLLLVNATDLDTGFNGKLVYAISGGNDDSSFLIGMETGIVKILSPLDRERKDKYTLNITVYDLGIPQKSAWCLLDVRVLDANDNSPEFLQDSYFVDVNENKELNTEIIQVGATDKDLGTNGEVRYSFLTDTDKFSIDSVTGIVKVVGPLDREEQPVHFLKIMARDQAKEESQLSSTVLLKVSLEDVNDNPPKFIPSNYRVKIREDLPEGTIITWLEAHDPDLGQSSQVRYSLLDGGDGSFDVDKLSGAIRLVRGLDFEKKQVYNLTVRAKDKGKPISLSSTCYVEIEVVDVNENLFAPHFPNFVDKGFVNEDVPIGTLVMSVSASDADAGRDGKIKYSIRDGSGVGIFRIDEDKGSISTVDLLDRETTSHYWVTVYATDQGVVPLSSFVEIYIEVLDVNDNAPQTTQPVYYPEVMENSPKDVSVIQIEAFDADSSSNDKLTYKITSGNPQGFFFMNPKTGLITTTSRKLDREQQAEHILEVTVTDNGIPAKSTLARVIVKILDENDNRPQFLQKFYQIKLPEREKPERERTARREPIYRVVAADKDEGPNAEISYSIEDGDEHGKFFIDPITGVVSSKKYSGAGEYDILTIKAVDNGRPQKSSTARLHIEWIPKPIPVSEPIAFEESFFSFTVMESDPVAHMIGVIAVEPLSTPLWFDITGGNYDSRFDVDKGTGTIVVAKPLDAEQKSNYNLTVEATDGTRTIGTQVYIKVIDTNDHRPEFSSSEYQVIIPEDTVPETEILKISASDRDEKNKLIYTMQSSMDPISLKKFRLDPATGSLYTSERLDHEAIHRHVLTVMVRDQDVPVKRNFARIIVNVSDTNDHAPWFTSSSYEGRVYESAAVGSVVLQVTALDKDKGENAEIVYSIESGNIGNAFNIHPILGSITIAKELDRNSQDEYTLMVKARDKGSPLMSEVTSVHISVTISDNAAPKFTMKEYSTEISEGSRIGSFIGMVIAYSQSSVVYEIKDGNIGDAFAINPNSGVITSQKTLDFETLPFYSLTIQSTNMAGQSANTTVLVHLQDENDNAPTFVQAEYTGRVSESASINSVVLTDKNVPLVIQAIDADKESNALLVYQIVEPSVHKYFAIDSSTGAIRTVMSLDYEETNTFHFSVQVYDMGTPHLFAEYAANVTIYVIDINDCPPVFSKDLYETSVLVPTYKGVKVVTVHAKDADSEAFSQIMYSIIEGNIGEKFSINSKTGQITVQNTTQLRSRYELTVRASDGRFLSTSSVKINVKESKASQIKFTRSSYSAVVQENSTEAKTIAVITPIGSQINEPLFYHILNPDNRFKISYTSGVLSTTGIPFDRELQESFDIVVEVTLEHKPSIIAHVVVKVTVEDVNDNAPVFVSLPYYATVKIDTEVGQVIRRVTAVDKDIGRNGRVHYYLKEHYDHFQIENTGEISLKKPFDPDTLNKEYLLLVVAKDGGEPSLSAEVTVPITVVNKAMPVFEKAFYSAEIPENIQIHSPVVHVQANSPEGLKVFYSITDGDPYNQFTINFNTGVINTFAPLDFESHPAYKLSVRATDSLTGAHAEVFVDIIVEDINDNPPLFIEQFYAAALSEASIIGTSVVHVRATDADSGTNRGISYHLVENNSKSHDYFHIDSSTGLILTARTLDYEQIQQHTLLVRAIDNGMPPLSSDVIVTVDITDLNDNPPVFNQLLYEANISELAPRGHFVTCVKASDADSSDADKLEYSILSGNDHMNFVINRKTGVIALSNLHKQTLKPLYHLNISVSDGVFRSSAQVLINVIGANLHSPIFGQNEYEVELAENAPLHTLVTEVTATDKDIGRYGTITYHIVNDFAKDRFYTNERGQIFTLEKLDRETQTEKVIFIRLMATDSGGKVAFCSINVILTDVNDNAPLFRASEYEVNIGSDVPRGTTVVKVLASDADEGTNADIMYAIEADSENVQENLEINPLTGVITTKESLIGLENEFLTFFVRALDGGAPQKESSVPLYVRILSPEVHLPKFSEPFYSYTLSENTPIGTDIDTIRAEHSHTLLYTLVKGNTPESNRDEYFVIDKHSGRLKLEKSLDHETTKWYQFSVLAYYMNEDYKVISSVDISIQIKDANDNQPILESNPYEAYIVENMPAGTKVIQVKAFDQDSGSNAQVTYRLEPTQDADIMESFSINLETGWITTLKELDHERQDKYRITVAASDRAEKMPLSSTAVVEVFVTDVNDNPPRFTAEIYKGTVSEDDPTGGVVAILSTTDADSEHANRQVSYFITGGDPLGQFAVENIQNEWKVYVRKPLDREVKDHYLLNITATDGMFATKAVVEVKVLDSNDNSPVCEKTLYNEAVSEDSPPGKLIMQVSATDADIRSNAEITYTLHGSGAEDFMLGPETGELKTLATLDREQKSAYTLMVRASDGGGRFCQASIILNIEDVNDNTPEFTTDPYSVTVFENTEPKTLLTRVQATDADAGLNQKIHYSLVDSTDGHFSIDEFSGIVRLEKPLDRELQAVYTLTLKAEDEGSPRRLSSLGTLVVSVLDINDNPPVFEYREYSATVSEDAMIGMEILQVYAASRDIEANAEITYSIVSGNEHGKFSIDSKTGAIFIIGSLDYESSPEYYLTMEATDGGTPSLSDVVTVTINVTDINDNTPVFSQDTYTAVISEDAEVEQSVISVMAADADGPLNNHIRYSIIDGNQGNPFTIDPTLGEVKVAKPLDREMISGYTLTVQASDNGNPPRINTTMVNIDVSDVNDNPPIFAKGNYSIIIQENKPVGFNIQQLVVTDNDSSHNGPPFLFTLVSGNEDNAFEINQQGVLSTAIQLKRKVKDHYFLHIKVADNGRPQLSSLTYVDIRVIEESIHPPAILPLEIFITTFGEEYAGGVIGKVHATDQDVYDTLTYSLDPSVETLFSVSGAGGKLIAHKRLDVGQYNLNVSVTDGKFTTAAVITVHIRQITPELLNHSITIRFANLAPEEFIGDYWRNFQRALRTFLGVRRSDIQIISLQPSDPPSNLEVLLFVEKSGNSQHSTRALVHKINASVADLEEISGIQILNVFHKLCLGLDCPWKYCEEKVTLDENIMSTHSTARLSFVTPHHHRTSICLCKEERCPLVNTACEGNPCPEGTECIADSREEKYTCVCHGSSTAQCPVSAGPAVTFTGSSYVKYRLMENENKEEMKLTLRLRTYSAHAVVMYARGTDYSILEIHHGRLQYKFDCGSGPGIVSVQSIQINDGQWHSVSLEVDGNYAKLILDRVHTASGIAPGTLRTLNLDNHVYFGGHIRQQGARHGRSPQVSNGFRGCMDSIVLNGQELPLNSKPRSYAHMEESVDVSPGCLLSSTEDCSSSPCQNGGICNPLPSGGYYCKCAALFMGTYCELSVNPCASNPCLYGGTCIPVNDDFVCQCRGLYTGQRCQIGPYCKDNPCKNSGKCIDSLDGPVCECEGGFHGERCLTDVDECMENPCQNGALCENTYGAYHCNCSHGFGGKHCAEVLNTYVSTSWNISLGEVLGIIFFLVGVFVLVGFFVFCRQVIRRKRKRQPEPEDKHLGTTTAFLQRPYFDSKLNKNIYSDIPPQVPVRPISYTPSIPSDSRNNLDRNSFEGSTIPEHPEFTTFNPDSVHGHRKAVAVCSVAPNLPPPPPSNSPSDSDSIQKPSWDFDYDTKVVDLDSCLSKKPLEEKVSQPYSARESVSEVQSLSSFQSESCDDNASLVTVIHLVNAVVDSVEKEESFAVPDLSNSRAYHWDTSDWMPNVQLPGIQEYPNYEMVEEPAPLYTDPNSIDADYYPGGYDIESDFPPPPDDFPVPDDLPPLPPAYSDQFDSIQQSRDMPAVGSLGSSSRSRQRFNLNQYLPHHYASDMSEPQNTTNDVSSTYREPFAPYTVGYTRDFEAPPVDNMSMSVYASTASCSDVSACCEMESEVMMSDYESGDDGHFEDVIIPPLDPQQHTQV
ncbi:protocadherin Fat 1 isoform X1 [Varanus komodoensis]|nr:protocadherin Fat 1 isoform X1 [Varanus komodoensis]XP_044311185.1 protocadherin Fat 1 isoform X1 [Varanus komodoensis]XP_044311187.1 protocadherin Fat 1 isoform X1 [Varanus komodoensis]XP_044311188.1 protocadherin Fat 1 isoform X1 [Varanus komodoensis]XP_044311189.1 protocadherin Fat 1 isoform X1 [Varanus komodoensis]XP_044311190.1 protocadherin Fat 1 isoform X1 [Varanus komodoensis]XP_044311191.1 protocadherin Fat 1 isoform X1 [Varanus komodoensis]XP_044311195.1 protocadherin Fat 1 isof